MLTDEFIRERLRGVCLERDIRLLVAVESGSRAWGLASPDSDYDVRFVYVHPVEHYLGLRDRPDMIGPLLELGGELDLVGWDVRKWLSHVAGSNPNALEWLASPIDYGSDPEFLSNVRSLADTAFDPARCFAHYRGIARSAEIKGRRDDGRWNVKKFFYYLRPLMVALHLRSRPNERPPITMDALMALEAVAPVRAAVESLLREKETLPEAAWRTIDPRLTRWAAATWAELEARASELERREAVDWAAADAVFRTVISLP